jgi:hypothetical protein
MTERYPPARSRARATLGTRSLNEPLGRSRKRAQRGSDKTHFFVVEALKQAVDHLGPFLRGAFQGFGDDLLLEGACRRGRRAEGARAGTKQPNIARLESGKVVPKLDFLEKVAHALGGRLDVRIVEGKGNA